MNPWEGFDDFRLDELRQLEAESIAILRETGAQFERPVMLYSIGKDSSVLLHLAALAFAPAKPPWPLLHVDTGYKPPEMIAFRDQAARHYGLELIVARAKGEAGRTMEPFSKGTSACCGLLKTGALLDALREGGFDAAIGGARRDEEKSRAKERIFSIRDEAGQWDPRRQRAELWNLYNGTLARGETARVFPLSNWTELDVWRYIALESIPVVPLYFAVNRPVLSWGGQLLDVEKFALKDRLPAERTWVRTRFRSLGCMPCSGLVASEADSIEAILAELATTSQNERAGRMIDLDNDIAMEKKKREGYF